MGSYFDSDLMTVSQVLIESSKTNSCFTRNTKYCYFGTCSSRTGVILLHHTHSRSLTRLDAYKSSRVFLVGSTGYIPILLPLLHSKLHQIHSSFKLSHKPYYTNVKTFKLKTCDLNCWVFPDQ